MPDKVDLLRSGGIPACAGEGAVRKKQMDSAKSVELPGDRHSRIFRRECDAPYQYLRGCRTLDIYSCQLNAFRQLPFARYNPQKPITANKIKPIHSTALLQSTW